MTGYRCHECGWLLIPLRGYKTLWCSKCDARRRVPTHPALIVSSPPPVAEKVAHERTHR